MIVQRFNLNLIPNQSPVIVHVNQYDTGTGRLIATLYEGNEPYSPNGTAVIQGTKPDGHGFQYTATLDGNVVTADLTDQMAPVAGDVRTQIVVTESSGVTGTFVFIMRVQPSALPSDTDMSESDYPIIEEAIREAREAMTESAESAETAEAWAQGTRGGIPVEPTDPTYEHNAEYWAQYAERYAQGGLHYKASIPFVDIPTTGMREGDMYDITDDFTTDSRFTEGAGIKVKGGTNIAWNSDNKWDILALPYIPKTTFNGRSGSILPMAGDYDSEKILLSSALHIGGETQNDVQEALEALENNKADRVDGAIADNFAGLDANGNLKDSGKNASDFATPSDIAGQQSLLKDTVGWTGKNLCDLSKRSYPVSYRDISVTFNGEYLILNGTQISNDRTYLALSADFFHSDLLPQKLEVGETYTITMEGSKDSQTPGLNYEASLWSSSTSVIAVTSNDNRLTFKYTQELENNNSVFLQIIISAGSGTFSNVPLKFMLRKASITDPTYEPYHESVEEEIEQIYTDNGLLGAKNLLENKATTQTLNTIVWAVDATTKKVTAGNQTASANSIMVLNDITLPAGSYKISGCPNYGSNDIYFQVIKSGEIDLKQKNGKPLYFTLSAEKTLTCRLVIASGLSGGNKIWEPMITLASDPDDTYQPYAMTNRELTDNVSPIEITDNWLTLPTDITKGDQYTVFKIGKLIIVNIVLCRNAGFDDAEFAIPINSQYQPIKQINANAVFQATQWATEGSLGYLYVANNLIIRNMQSTPVNFCKINIAYICK